MNETRADVPRLRLVHDGTVIARHEIKIPGETRQLSLPLPEPNIIVILDVTRTGYHFFKNTLEHIRPKWIFDIRAVPRLDTIGGGRSHALREFEKIGSRYVDVFGILGVSNFKKALHNPSFWTDIVEGYIKSSPDNHGPYLALLDDNVMMNSISRHFASSISHVTGRDVSLSKIDGETQVTSRGE